MSYSFGADTGLTYEQAQNRRRIAEQLRTMNRTTPQNVGEGIGAIARALVARGSDKQATQAETRLQGEFDDQFAALMGGNRQPRAPARSAPSTGSLNTPPPVTSTPLLPSSDPLSGITIPQETPAAFDLAAKQIGMNENEQNAALSDYLATGGQNLDPAQTAWCAAFVNATLNQTGQQGTGALNARSFLDWGQEVKDPQKGDIAVFSRGDPNGWQGHVGFFDGYNDDGSVRVLGGNQSDGVNIASYGADRLLGFRRGGAGSPQPAAPTTSPQGGGYGTAVEIAQLMSNPMASEGQRAVMEVMLQQAMPQAPMSQMDQIQLERAQLELDQMRNPTPEYQMLTPEEVAELGLPEGSYQLNREGRITRIGGATTNVNIDNGQESSQWGEPPKDSVWLRDEAGEVITEPDPSGRGVRPVSVPIANSEASQEQAFKAQDGMALIDSVINDPALAGITGMVQGRLPPMTQAGTDLNVKIEQIKGQAFLQAFESLKGGGQITEREGIAAQNAMARLNRAQSTEAYVESLTELQGILRRSMTREAGWASTPEGKAYDENFVIPGESAVEAPNADRSAFLNNPQAKSFAANSGMTVDELWENMSPEDRALFQ